MKREVNGRKRKRAKVKDEECFGSVYIDDNVLFEVLKHVDARSLAMAGCVSKQWHKTAKDERLWEVICTRGNTGCGQEQLRSVVLALGGFRRLHALYLWPLSKLPLGKDHLHLSLSLLSIRYYETINFHNT